MAVRATFILLFCLLWSACSHAYTWTFENSPTQCESLKVNIEGNDGQPPYRLLLIPYGAAPGVEVRDVQTITFNSSADGSKHLDFLLNYPSNSQFVAVVGDSNNFASGGTSKPWTVRASSDNSCFDASRIHRPIWPFFYMKPDGLRSCEENRIFWNTSNPNITGTVNFVAVYPGGQSFNITSSPLTEAVDGGSSNTTGFNWKVPFNPGADILLVSGDQKATGAGGSVPYRVSPPQDPNNVNCIPNMPSMTAAPYAGGDPNADLSHKHRNIGAIAGGVVAGVVALIGIALGIWFLVRQRKRKSRYSFDGAHPEIDNRLSFVAQPYPMSEHVTPFANTPQPPGSPSGQPLLGPSKSRLPDVQYVQHQDADDSGPPSAPPQTVDLPPRYNPNRRPTSSSGDSRSRPGSSSGSMSFTASTKPSHYGDRKIRPLPNPSTYGGSSVGASSP